MNLVILAAGQGKRLRPLTDQKPKTLVTVGGKTILEHLLEAASSIGFKEIVVVGGYKAKELESYPIEVIHNPYYETTNMVRSLFCAKEYFSDGFILSYGDILFRPKILRELAGLTNDISVVVDKDWLAYWQRRVENPLEDAETLAVSSGQIVEIGGQAKSVDEIEAQFIGLMAFRGDGVMQLREAYDTALVQEESSRLNFGRAASVDQMYMTDLLQGLADMEIALMPHVIQGGWLEIDTISDRDLAERMLCEGRLSGKS